MKSLLLWRNSKICSKGRATNRSRISGVIRGAAANRSGARSTTARSRATNVTRASLIISGCRNARGIGIATNTRTFRRRHARWWHARRVETFRRQNHFEIGDEAENALLLLDPDLLDGDLLGGRKHSYRGHPPCDLEIDVRQE